MKVLLCSPKYFDVTEFDPDNKHMDPANKPNKALAFTQHDKLVQLYEDLGLEVYLIPPRKGLVDMTFSANCGFVDGQLFIPSRFKPLRRRDEAGYYENFFRELGYNICHLSGKETFEGAGDAIPYKDKILCGYGFRTSKEALPYLERFAQKEVVPLKLVRPGKGKKICYHLDTAGIFLEEAGALIMY